VSSSTIGNFPKSSREGVTGINTATRPKRIYTSYLTPLQFLKNFTAALKGPNVYMKRDDLSGLTAGGNKTRKLEYIMADAIEQGADTIITCGATQSNHCRLTLAASVKEGLDCVLVLEEVIPGSYHQEANGNILLYHLLGADITVVPKGTDMQKEMEKAAEKVRMQGGHPYLIPLGGSNVLGGLGYVDCAHEILGQAREMAVDLDAIVVASGSGATHAGLLAGLNQLDSSIPVIGISVSRNSDDAEGIVWELTESILEELAAPKNLSVRSVRCLDDYVGEGYAIPTPSALESIRQLAKTEGILLDPVYTGKVMAGLVDLAKKGAFNKGDNILFIHTGGLPTVFGSASIITGNGLGDGRDS